VKIAIIGTGISGLTAAYLLHKDYDLTLYEANSYVGGHTNTLNIDLPEGRYAVDTGFIVFNEVTYPCFCQILKRLGVDSQPTRMTFSVKCEKTGLEYSPHNLNAFFAQRRNLLSPSFWRLIMEIFRLRSHFDRILDQENAWTPLVPYLRERGFSARFIELFIVPLGASLWSTDPERFEEFPLETFVRFFKNHGFLHIRNPFEWRVIRGGSKKYVEKMTHGFAGRIRTDTPVTDVQRFADRVEVSDRSGAKANFDHVILAVHSDQALAMLKDPTPAEREILGAIPYRENDTVLHIDPRILPKRSWIWSSWNYLITREEQNRGSLTYDMNILQSLNASQEFCVTLNRTEAIDPALIKGRFTYHHPQFTPRAPEVQLRHGEISGLNRTHYCGAYWGYGFHEDGVKSGLKVARWFGKEL
jgi:predicted NAD/FAD-binding protein